MSSRYLSASVWLTCLAFFNGECAYCGCTHEKLTGDHLIPRSKGGESIPENIVPACSACNSEKADKEWRDYLMSKDNFSQARLNRIFNWRRICKQARLK